LSPRAAARLETFGFDRVHDYAPGKMDWLAYGLPVEKKTHGIALVAERLQREFPIARLGDSRADWRWRTEQSGFTVIPVLTENGVLIGLLEHLHTLADADLPVENVMNPAPVTLRPSASVENAIKQLDRLDADELPVTSSDGKLLGIFKRPKPSASAFESAH
jgi:predicted transcriptional regulator